MIDTNSFKDCGDDCDVCARFRQRYEGIDEEVTTDMLKEYGLLMGDGSDKKRKTAFPFLVCGDLLKEGWAVYRGADLSSSNKHSNLKIELKGLIDLEKKDKFWEAISNTQRKKLDLTSLDFAKHIKKSRKKNGTPSTDSVFVEMDKMLSKIKIDTNNKKRILTNANSHYVLANFGELDVQETHRDKRTVGKSS